MPVSSAKDHLFKGSQDQPGLVTIAMEEILQFAASISGAVKVSSYLVVQDTHIFDLLEPKEQEVLVLDDAQGKTHLKGLSKVHVKSIEDFLQLGCFDENQDKQQPAKPFSTQQRPTKASSTQLPTKGHQGLIIHISSSDQDGKERAVAKINFLSLTDYVDPKQKTGGALSSSNKTMYTLMNVVQALNNNQNFVPYRQSKVTRILQDSLCKTSGAVVIACLEEVSCQDTISTLSLAARSSQAANEQCHRSISVTSFKRADVNSSAVAKSSSRPILSSMHQPNPVAGKQDLPQWNMSVVKAIANKRLTPGVFRAMSSKLLLPPAAPAAKPLPIPSMATTTTLATAAAGTTTISSLGQDQLFEIFLRLPSLPALVRAALTCRSWLGAVRSSRSFRSLFRALHPAPLVGIFLEINEGSVRSFAPFCRSDPDVNAALRRGDFFLTSLPAEDDEHASCWSIMDCRDGYILLWNMVSVAVVNPMTWAVDIIPVPEDAWKVSDWKFTLCFHLQFSENPWPFHVVCVCSQVSRVRVAIFSSETRDWDVHSWMEIGGEFNMQDSVTTLLGGSIYQSLCGEARAIRINRATMEVSSLYLPSLATYGDSMVGDTEDGKLCMVYASDGLLHVWIRSGYGDGIESWVLQGGVALPISLRAKFDEDWKDQVRIVEVRSGRVYFSMTCIPGYTMASWFFYLSIKTMKIEFLMEGMSHDNAYPYTMAWPPCLIGDDRSTEHEVRGCLLKSSNSTTLTEQVQALQREEILKASLNKAEEDVRLVKTSLNKAEEDVKLLFEEKRALDEANKRLLCLLEKEQKHGSETEQHSATNPTKHKCKSSSPVGLAIDFNSADASRQPNSPDCGVQKK
uniref:Kinesin motor domain-containing protein n=1 Tax=Triticum aestivum TaxID=4565 RepID=A0A3B6PVF6_WHEAT